MGLELTLLDHLGIKFGTFPSIYLLLFDLVDVFEIEVAFLDPCYNTQEVLILGEDIAFPLEYEIPNLHEKKILRYNEDKELV
jgi:hypothetical protein